MNWIIWLFHSINTGHFIMHSGITKIYCRKTVGHVFKVKHTEVHIPARWKSHPLPLWGLSVPEHSITRTLGGVCVWKWPTTDAMAPEVPWYYALWFFCLGMCQRPGIRPTIATWPHWPKGMDHCSSEEYRRTHVDACVARTWISYRCVLCHMWCTSRTSLVVKKNFFSFPVAVNNSIKVDPLVFLL
jgi:hypothetical protein